MGQSDILEMFHFPAWEINLFGELPWELEGFPGSSTGKESTYSAGDLDLIPGLGRSPGEGNGNPLQYSFLENPHGQRSHVVKKRHNEHLTLFTR